MDKSRRRNPNERPWHSPQRHNIWPTLASELGYNAYNYTNLRIAKGDFVRLKEVSLGYDMPAKWFQKAVVKTCRSSCKPPISSCFMPISDLMAKTPNFITLAVWPRLCPNNSHLQLNSDFKSYEYNSQ